MDKEKAIKIVSQCLWNKINEEKGWEDPSLDEAIEALEVLGLKKPPFKDKYAKERAELKIKFKKALEILEEQPHPHWYFRKQGKTLADYYRYKGTDIRNMKNAIEDAKNYLQEKGEIVEDL